MKYAKFEEVSPARLDPASPLDRDEILAALIEQNRVHNATLIRLIWAVMIIGVAVFVPLVNQHLLPLLRGQ